MRITSESTRIIGRCRLSRKHRNAVIEVLLAELVSGGLGRAASDHELRPALATETEDGESVSTVTQRPHRGRCSNRIASDGMCALPRRYVPKSLSDGAFRPATRQPMATNARATAHRGTGAPLFSARVSRRLTLTGSPGVTHCELRPTQRVLASRHYAYGISTTRRVDRNDATSIRQR